MKFLYLFSVTVSITISMLSCIKEVQVDLRNVKPILVVEGAVTTDPGPYSVRVTYSGMIELANQVPEENLEKDAVVVIKDDAGNATPTAYSGNGYYQTTDLGFVGVPGRTYHVEVTLKDGRKYISLPEKMRNPVPVDSITIKFIEDFNIDHPTYLRAYVNTTDPAAEENFYKWEFLNYTRRQTPGVGCGFGCIKFEYCFQKYVGTELNIFSDASINGNAILSQGVGSSYIFTYGNHYFDISQISISREAYQFWNIYSEQTNRTGDILDPLPATIRGNIVNAADNSEFALGFFSANAIYHKKVIAIPFSITEYLLTISAVSFRPTNFVACFDYYPNTLSYPDPPADQAPPPPGWENADSIKVYW
jgi:hypothetical protein